MATKIQFRRDTAANWNTANPVLMEGELGIETDANKAKIGDGTSAWKSLPYILNLQKVEYANIDNLYNPLTDCGIYLVQLNQVTCGILEVTATWGLNGIHQKLSGGFVLGGQYEGQDINSEAEIPTMTANEQKTFVRHRALSSSVPSGEWSKWEEYGSTLTTVIFGDLVNSGMTSGGAVDWSYFAPFTNADELFAAAKDGKHVFYAKTQSEYALENNQTLCPVTACIDSDGFLELMVLFVDEDYIYDPALFRIVITKQGEIDSFEKLTLINNQNYNRLYVTTSGLLTLAANPSTDVSSTNFGRKKFDEIINMVGFGALRKVVDTNPNLGIHVAGEIQAPYYSDGTEFSIILHHVTESGDTEVHSLKFTKGSNDEIYCASHKVATLAGTEYANS